MKKQELLDTKSKIRKKIKVSDNFIILISDPDEDAVASGLAVEEILDQFGKKSKLYSSFPLNYFSYLPRFKKFLVKNIKEVDFGQYDVAIVLDSGELSRVLDVEDRLEKFSLPKDLFVINIDHHFGNLLFGDLNYVPDKISSTGEAIYDLFQDEIDLTKSLTTNLLASILGDTECFKYTSNSYPKSLRLAAKLIELGGDHKNIINHIFYNIEKKVVDMNIDAMQRIKVKKVSNYKYAYTIFYGEKYGIYNVTRKQRHLTQEGVIRAIKGLDFSLIITPVGKNITKLSFRSSIKRVRDIAEHFGGGGHIEASGATTKLKPEQIITKLDKYLNKANLKDID